MYHFAHAGASVEVAYEDTFALLGERELRVKRQA
jgi:hypothetical protein